jgi:hypothetical protein
MSLLGYGQEVEVLGVFQNLFREVGVGGWQSPVEVGQRLPFPFMQSTLNLQHHHVPAPAILDGGPEVPLP